MVLARAPSGHSGNSWTHHDIETIFRITGPFVCGFGPKWIFLTKDQLMMCFLLLFWTICWTNNCRRIQKPWRSYNDGENLLLIFRLYSCFFALLKFNALFSTQIILLSNRFFILVLCTVIIHRRSLYSVLVGHCNMTAGFIHLIYICHIQATTIPLPWASGLPVVFQWQSSVPGT